MEFVLGITIINIIFFIIGLLIITKAGDIFIDAATWIANALNIPNFVVGATIVALATTLPEMVISLLSAHQGITEMAVGNAIGSVTVNTALVMALAFLFMNVKPNRNNIIIQSLILIAVTITTFLGSITGTLQVMPSLIAFFLFVMFIIWNIKIGRKEEYEKHVKQKQINRKDLCIQIGKFIFSFLMIYLGSRILILSSTELARIVGVSDRVISVTLVAIGTSLPELTTTIIAIKKHNTELSIGNIVGANVIDIALVLPLCSLISGSPIAVNRETIALDFPVCLAAILIALLPCLIKEKGSKLQGISLLAVYAFYVSRLVM